MRLYIDKANLISFLNLREDIAYSDIYADCKRMIKRQLSVQYNFPKEQWTDDDILKAWFLGATDGCGYNDEETIFVSDENAVYPQRPLKGTFYNQANLSQLSSVYLLDSDVSAIQRSHTVLAGGVGEEIETLKKLFCGNDYDYHKGYDLQDDCSFAGWQKLDEDGHILPCTDILVSDRYIFKNKDRIKNNLSVFLRLFGQKKGAKINLVIVSQNKNHQDGNNEDWQIWIREFERELKYNKYCAAKITFVISYDCPHDRIIITNYRTFKSGSSFVYFDAVGHRAKDCGNTLDVESLAKTDAEKYARNIIVKIQTIIDNLNSLKRSDDLIVGDKISSWLKF